MITSIIIDFNKNFNINNRTVPSIYEYQTKVNSVQLNS